ncbi:MAG: orotidine 5'-phosphate decarboxylase / HUMPS family protein [Candidatus Bathyarchaeia archaeon]
MFNVDYGIIVACDVEDLKALCRLVKSTYDLEFVAGYKVGSPLAIRYGLRRISRVIKGISRLPVIYDHQKYGTDIPEICAGPQLKAVEASKIEGLIIFPQAGIETLKRTVESCLNAGITPIVGGEMTHKGYLEGEGGYISGGAPEKVYRDAAALGVTHFVVPGNKPASIERYKGIIKMEGVGNPVFMFPGVGRSQGGDVKAALKAIKPHRGFPIIGRGIYGEPDPRGAAMDFWRMVKEEIE